MTPPSITSLMTSLYPSQHRIYEHTGTLDAYPQVLPKILSQSGYNTAQYSANVAACDPSYGFEIVLCDLPDEQAPRSLSPLGFRYFPLGRHIDKLFSQKLGVVTWSSAREWYFDAPRLVGALSDNWEMTLRLPFFLHLHFFEPHNPYFEHPSQTIQWNIKASWNRSTLLERYDSEIGFADEYVGRVLALLNQKGIKENTIIIVTSDHGEEFQDHGGWYHGHTLYNEVIHVPLLIHLPDALRDKYAHYPDVVTGLTENVDIAPTILDLIGQPIPQEYSGSSLLQLKPDNENQGTNLIFAEQKLPLSILHAVRNKEWKLIRQTGHTRKTELFNMNSDPTERNNIAEQYPAIVAELAEGLTAHIESMNRSRLKYRERQLSTDEIERLRSMGYLQ